MNYHYPTLILINFLKTNFIIKTYNNKFIIEYFFIIKKDLILNFLSEFRMRYSYFCSRTSHMLFKYS